MEITFGVIAGNRFFKSGYPGIVKEGNHGDDFCGKACSSEENRQEAARILVRI